MSTNRVSVGLSSHVLDTATGRPAAGLPLRLEVATSSHASDEAWQLVAAHVTDADGRVRDLLAGRSLEARTYKLVFDTATYLRAQGRPVFYPRVEIVFAVSAPTEHHHIPLLLAPFGYSTYRGS